MKKCWHCQEEKSLDLFNKNSSKKDGLQDECRECNNALCRKRLAAKESTLRECECGKSFRSKGALRCHKCRNTKKYFCEDCGISVTKKAARCKKCAFVLRRGEGHHLWNGKMTRPRSGGYIEYYCPGHPRAQRNYVPEHVFVMEQFIGRYVSLDETVHHRNGLRSDNRLENLELWASKHPPGQRLLELLFWAEQIVEEYGPIKEKLLELESNNSEIIC